MTQEEIEEGLDIILEAISNSKLNNYAKIELMLNLKKFFLNYNKNIKILRENDKRIK